jgi:Flp pilus assembly protein TadD
LDDAVASLTQAIELKPDFAEAFSNLGNSLKDIGRLDEAEARYTQAIALRPNYAEAHSNLGNTLKEMGRLEEAVVRHMQAIELKPDYAEAYSNLGLTLQELGRCDEAEASYRHAISLKPDFFQAHNNLGSTLKNLGRLDEAEASYNQAIALKPDYAEAYSNLGVALKELGRLDEAEESHNKAIGLKPDYAQGHCNLGVTLQEGGRLEEAEASHRKAIALQPDQAEAHLNLSFILLKSDRLKEGLEEHEWRWDVAEHKSSNRRFPQPLWDGQKSLHDKRILLWSEQGIGDTLNWASCLPLVASLAGHTILECQEKVVSLLERSFPDIEVRPQDRRRDSKREDFDFHLPMGSLYRHFIQHIGKSDVDAYLIPNPSRVKFWQDRLRLLGEGPYIGICWKSSLVSPYRLRHYPPTSAWSSVLEIPDVTFVNLQYCDFADDLIDIENDIGVTVHHFDDLDQYDDLDDVAALCAALDMVVSTKAAPLILSSGVGTLTKVANWRQSIWHSVLFNPVSSSVEIIHRDTCESWENVFNSIAEDILELKDKAITNSADILRD